MGKCIWFKPLFPLYFTLQVFPHPWDRALPALHKAGVPLVDTRFLSLLESVCTKTINFNDGRYL